MTTASLASSNQSAFTWMMSFSTTQLPTRPIWFHTLEFTPSTISWFTWTYSDHLRSHAWRKIKKLLKPWANRTKTKVLMVQWSTELQDGLRETSSNLIGFSVQMCQLEPCKYSEMTGDSCLLFGVTFRLSMPSCWWWPFNCCVCTGQWRRFRSVLKSEVKLKMKLINNI